MFVRGRGNGPGSDTDMQLQVEQLKRDIGVLHEQELEVDRFVNQMSELIRKGLEEQHTAGKDGQAYVTREDLQG